MRLCHTGWTLGTTLANLRRLINRVNLPTFRMAVSTRHVRNLQPDHHPHHRICLSSGNQTGVRVERNGSSGESCRGFPHRKRHLSAAASDSFLPLGFPKQHRQLQCISRRFRRYQRHDGISTEDEPLFTRFGESTSEGALAGYSQPCTLTTL